jgi:hypothetical protein
MSQRRAGSPCQPPPAAGADNFTRLVPADWPDRLQLTRNQRTPPATNTTTTSPSPSPSPSPGNATDPPGTTPADPPANGVTPGPDNSSADSGSTGLSSALVAAVVAPVSLVLLVIVGFVATRRAVRLRRGAHQRLPSTMSGDMSGFGGGSGGDPPPGGLSGTLSWVSCCISRPLLGSGYYTIDGDGASSAAASRGPSRRGTDASGGVVGRHLAAAGRLGLLEEGSETSGPLSREEEDALDRTPLLPRLKYHTMPACPAALLQKLSEAAAAAAGQAEVSEHAGGGGSPVSTYDEGSVLPDRWSAAAAVSCSHLRGARCTLAWSPLWNVLPCMCLRATCTSDLATRLTPQPTHCRLLKTWGGALVGDAWELPSHLLSQLERRRTVGLPPLEPLPPPITAR